MFKIHSFLGLVGCYRRFVKDFLSIALPLTKLSHKELDLCGVTNVNKVFNS